MLKHLTVENLTHIARNGGGLEVDAAQFTHEDFAHIARNLTNGATLKLHNCQRFNAEDLAHIARNGSGKVIFS